MAQPCHYTLHMKPLTKSALVWVQREGWYDMISIHNISQQTWHWYIFLGLWLKSEKGVILAIELNMAVCLFSICVVTWINKKSFLITGSENTCIWIMLNTPLYSERIRNISMRWLPWHGPQREEDVKGRPKTTWQWTIERERKN